MTIHFYARAMALMVASLGFASSAHADPTPADRVEARTLFDDARDAMKNLDFKAACPKLEESQRLVPGLGTRYHLASCYEGQGRLASAWTTFLDVAEAAQRAGQTERSDAARARAVALEPRLPHLHITLVGADHRTLSLDGSPLADGLVNALVPVDPGDHVVGADAPGKFHWESHVDAKEGTTVELSVPPMQDAPTPQPPAMAPAVAVPLEAAPSPHARTRSTWRAPAAVTAVALGVVGIGIGTAFGIATISDWSTAKPGCPNGACTKAAYPYWSSAHTAGTVSTATFIVGGSLIATGAVIWFTRPRDGASVGLLPAGIVFAERF